jgi:hypothetical protein
MNYRTNCFARCESAVELLRKIIEDKKESEAEQRAVEGNKFRSK